MFCANSAVSEQGFEHIGVALIMIQQFATSSMDGIMNKAYFSCTGGLGRAGFCCRLGEDKASKEPVFLWALSGATDTVRSLGKDPDLGRRKPV